MPLLVRVEDTNPEFRNSFNPDWPSERPQLHNGVIDRLNRELPKIAKVGIVAGVVAVGIACAVINGDFLN